MNIQIEGPKGIGKSYLLNNVKNSLESMGYNVVIYHFTRESGGNFDVIYNQLIRGKREDTIYLYDRLFLSELVYTDATPGRSVRFTPEQFTAFANLVDFTIILDSTMYQNNLLNILTRDRVISDLDKAILDDSVKGFNNIEAKYGQYLGDYYIAKNYDVPSVRTKEQTKILKMIVDKIIRNEK